MGVFTGFARTLDGASTFFDLSSSLGVLDPSACGPSRSL